MKLTNAVYDPTLNWKNGVTPICMILSSLKQGPFQMAHTTVFSFFVKIFSQESEVLLKL